MVKILLGTFEGRPKEEKQAFLDAPNDVGNTGLHWAALGGHLDTVKFLMEQGASGGLANDRNYVPLDLANFNGHSEVAAYFLGLSGKIEGDNQSGLSGATEGVDLDGGDEENEEVSGGSK
jgi:ankyrin repeat protein